MDIFWERFPSESIIESEYFHSNLESVFFESGLSLRGVSGSIVESRLLQRNNLHILFFFFNAGVDAFKPENISEMVLLRLLKQDVIFHIKLKDKDIMKDDPACVIYQQVGR